MIYSFSLLTRCKNTDDLAAPFQRDCRGCIENVGYIGVLHGGIYGYCGTILVRLGLPKIKGSLSCGDFRSCSS